MTHLVTRVGMVFCIGVLALSGCATKNGKKPELVGEMDVIDEAGLNDIMLTMADPNQAAEHFRRLLAREPDNPDHMRGLAVSLVRARRAAEAAPVYQKLIDSGKATTNDRLLFAESLVAAGAIPEAEEQLGPDPAECGNLQALPARSHRRRQQQGMGQGR